MAYVVIPLIALLLYANTLSHSFVYDDHLSIVASSLIRSWENLPDLVMQDYFVRSGEFTYRPVVTFTYLVDYSLWGLSPFGYHLTNLLLHTVTGLLLFFFSFHLTKDKTVSLITALLFVSHPVLTEAVNGISNREDLLVGLFVLGGALLSLKGWQGGSLVCYALALFSKEMGITLPLLFLLYDLCFSSQEEIRKKALFYGGCLVIAVIYLFARFILLYNPLEEFLTVKRPFQEQLVIMPKALLLDLQLMFFPAGLSVEHLVPNASSFLSVSLLIAVLAVAGLSYRVSREIFFSVWWVVITLLPVSNLVSLGNPVAERYLYLPAMGACLFVSLLLKKAAVFVFPVRHRLAQGLATGMTVGLLSMTTVSRNTVWENDLTLWKDAVDKTPLSSRAHNGLADVYAARGLVEHALREYQIAVELNPDYEEARIGRDNMVKRKKDRSRPQQATERRLLSDPAAIRRGRGGVYDRMGLYQYAVAEYQEALRFDPLSAETHNGLGISYDKMGRHEEAIREFQEALRLKPGYKEAHNDLGVAYAKQGLADQAVREFQEALRIDQDFADALKNLGFVYLTVLKDEGKAAFYLTESLKRDPEQEGAAALREKLKELEKTRIGKH